MMSNSWFWVVSGNHRPSLDVLTLFDTGTQLPRIDDRIASTIGLDESRSIGCDFTKNLRTLLDEIDGRILPTGEQISLP